MRETNSFNVGDRVRLLRNCANGFLKAGSLGTVVMVSHSTIPPFYDLTSYAVSFDTSFDGGFDLFGLCEKNHGWCVLGDALELVEPAEVSSFECATCDEIMSFVTR